MTSHSVLSPMTPKERAQHGAFVARDAAFDAVYGLWRQRRMQNWTLKQAAATIDADEGWLCKQFQGPRNWTMETFGSLIEALDGHLQIIVRAKDDLRADRDNYDAYAEMEDGLPKGLPRPRQPKTESTKIEKLDFISAQ
jgi:hypothetical protein